MTVKPYSTIIIGAGSGGLTVAIGLANLGKQVAVIEANHVGGDCTNTGCVPSRAFNPLSRKLSSRVRDGCRAGRGHPQTGCIAR